MYIIIIVFALNNDSMFVVSFFLCVWKKSCWIGKYIKMYGCLLLFFALNNDDSMFVASFCVCVEKKIISGTGKYIKMYGCL